MTEAANPRSPETLEIDVSVHCPLWTEALADSERLSREAAAAAYKAAGDGPGPAEASIVLADDAFVRGRQLDQAELRPEGRFTDEFCIDRYERMMREARAGSGKFFR